MSIEAILSNAATVVSATTILDEAGVVTPHRFREAEYRHALEDQPVGPGERLFQALDDNMTTTLARHGAGDTVRSSVLRVRVKYFRGGGDAGGQAAGGDYLSVNARAVSDMLRLASRLENDTNYDAQVTGIRRQVMASTGFNQTATGDKFEVWDLVLNVEWEQVMDVRAVA